ncbi:CrpP family ICE-associated protein [Pseudomonas sp. EpS/L25]|uniref:CrpP family ICE-associated protein n=1 Tax=Pseudomonas sp. EpS/L25 TaxID=1749078 RepID=UPI0009EBBE0E|nr:CrpP family ICE-associated protein [Pseudomonas sp. EpS/L25]
MAKRAAAETKLKPHDRRSGALAHAATAKAGAEAAMARAGLHTCPYTHPPFRASWLKGYQRAAQLTLDV